MRSNKIKMAYYGILMKDGTELTHYGVKGMKWGKSRNKPKGKFGKPSRSNGMMTWQNGSSNPGKEGRTRVAEKKANGLGHNFGDDDHFRTNSFSPEHVKNSIGAQKIQELKENNEFGSHGRTSRTYGVETMGQVDKRKRR